MEGELEVGLCPVCNEYRHDLHHNGTVNHRFHFAKWQYNEFSKPLSNNRHGIVLDAQAEQVNNFRFIFKYIGGKYTVKVSPEQLRLHNKTISFKCTIANTRRDPIFLINSTLLHRCPYFTIKHTTDFEDDNTLIKLLPGATYHFQVLFKSDVLSNASYKIPLTCDFQTIDEKSFSIVRTFLAVVDDELDTEEEKIKSPFTSKPWKDVKSTISSTKDSYFVDEYPIPGKYIKILSYGLDSFEGMNVNDEENLRDLRELLAELSLDNYKRFWHVLLWLEERAQGVMLMRYNMETVTVKVSDKGVIVLEVPGLAEKRPSVIVGDFIKIRVSGDHTAYKGYVYRVNDKTVEITHVDEDFLEYLQEYPETELDVAFMLSRLAFERMHRGVDRVVDTGMVATLFPSGRRELPTSNTFTLRDVDLFNKTIADNSEQKKAVEKILNVTHDLPYIVFGPPGTGKTVTIVEAILQIKNRTKKKILVCAPSNSACDMLAIKLLEKCKKEELIRIHSSTRERTTITAELKGYSNMDEDDDSFTKINEQILYSHRIVVSTLTLIGRFTNKYKPDCVFIDEAAQASEPETDIAIALVQPGKQVILAGDPEQLGPMTTKCAEKFGLGRSLLARLMENEVYSLDPQTRTYDPNFITMLKLNFRSHPDILHIPNLLFYDNLLEPKSTSAMRDPIVGTSIFPVILNINIRREGQAIEFYSVHSKERREGSSPSYFNPFEANVVVKYVTALMRLNLPSAYRVRMDQIGVVTPYKRQVHKIKDRLKHQGFEAVEVGTTESFQGREKRVIIISTVRAQHSLLLHDRKYNLGFVGHNQRFNVAVTRAISKLVVVGCPLVLARDDKWKMFMQLCEERGSYFGKPFDFDTDDFKNDVLNRMNKFKHKDDQYQ